MSSTTTTPTRSLPWADRLPKRWTDLSLRIKFITVILLLTVIAVGSIAWLNIRSTNQALTNQVSESLESLALSEAQNLGTVLARRLQSVEALATDDNLQIRTRAQNATYFGTLDTIEARLNELDEQWQAAGNNDNLIREKLDNTLSDKLKEFMRDTSDFVEVFVTDRYGGLVAASSRTSDYYQADEEWWQAAFDNGRGAVHIGEPQRDESTGVLSINMAVPIRDPDTGDVVGVLRTTYDANNLATRLFNVTGQTGEADLVLPDGQVLSPHGTEHQPFSPDLLERMNAAPQDHFSTTFKDHAVLLGYAPLTSVTDDAVISDLGWRVVVHEDSAEALAAVSSQTRSSLLLVLFIGVIAVVVGVGTGQLLVTPISHLTNAVKRFNEGDLNARVEIESEDETGILASNFNALADRVSGLVTGMEDRGQELEERTKELEASQRVTIAASERTSPDDLLGLVVNLIRDQFDLYHVQVYIVDKAQETAVLRESTGYAGRQLLQQKHQIPLDRQSLVTEAINTGEPVLVSDVTKGEGFMPNPLLPDTHAELVVPLKVGDEVIGALDAQDRTAGRFNESTVALFQTMVDQVAFLFENSELLQQVTEQTETLTLFTNQLRTAADIAQRLGAILNPEELLQQVVSLLQSRFGLYHAHIYVLDEAQERLIVRAGSGEVGRVLTERGHSIPLDNEKSVVARAARERDTMLIEDTALVSDFMPNPFLPQTRSEMAVPLVVGDRVLGVLDVQDDQAKRFTQADIDTFSTLAGQVATSLQNAGLFEQTQARLQVSQALATVQTEEQVLDAMIQVADFYPQAQVSIFTFEQQGDQRFATMRRVDSFDSGISSPVQPGMRFPLDQYPLIQYVDHDSMFISANVDLDERFDAASREIVKQGGIRSLALMPLTAGSEEIGLLVASSRQDGYFDERKLYLYNALAEQGTVALRTARLRAEVQEREERLSLMVSSVQDYAIITLDPKGHVTSWNEGAQRNKGYTADEILGQHFSIFYPEEDVKAGKTEMELEVAAEKGRFEDEGWRVRKDGSRFWANVVISAMYDDQGNLRGFSKVTRDITEQRKAEQALATSRQNLRTVFDSVHDAIFIHEMDGSVTDVNEQMLRMFKVTAEEALRYTIADDLSSPNNPLDQLPEMWAKAVAGEPQMFEWEARRPHDNSFFPVEAVLRGITLEDRDVILATVRDITERKQAEEQLREQEEKFRTVADFTYDWEYWIDPHGEFIYVSPACEKITGYTVQEFMDDPELLDRIAHPDDRHLIAQHTHDELDHDQVHDVEFRVITRKGEERWVGHICQPVHNADGDYLGRRASNRDITEQKKTELAMQESEARFRGLFEQSSDATLLIQEGQFVDCNQAAVDMLGFRNRKELLGTRPVDLSPETQPDGAASFVKEQEMINLALEKGSHRFEWIHTKADGTDFPVEVMLTPIMQEGQQMLHTVWRDITERKQAEQERERFAAQLGTAADIATQVSTILDPDEMLDAVIPLLHDRFDLYHVHFYRLDEASEELVLRAGYGEPGRIMVEEGHRIPLDREQSLVAQAARSQEPVLVNDVTLDPNFMPNPLLPDTRSEVAVPAIATGEVVGVFDVQHDRTDHFTQADLNVFSTLAGQLANAFQNAELYERAERERALYDSILTNLPVGVWVADNEFNVLLTNEYQQNMMGREITDRGGSTHTELYDVINTTTGEAYDETQLPIVLTMADGQPHSADDLGVRHPDGTVVPLLTTSGPLLDPEGNQIGAVAISTDITEQRQAEQAIRESEERLSLMVSSVQDYAIITLDPQGHVTSWNEGAQRTKGYTTDEILGQHFSIFYPEEDVQAGKTEMMLEIATEDGRFEDEGWRVRKDGSRFWASVIITAMYDDQGNLRGFSKVTRDITESKKAQDALRENQQLLQAFLDNFPDIAFVKDKEGHIILSNQVLETTFAIEGEDSLIGKTVYDMVPKEAADEIWGSELRVLETGETLEIEELVPMGDELRTKYTVKFPLHDAEGQVYAIGGVSTDITERKQSEERLREQEEKFRTVADFTYDWEYWIDPHGEFIYVSPACEKITGYTVQEFIEDPELLDRIAHPDDRHLIAQHTHDELDHDQVHDVEFRVITREGEERWVGHICQPVHNTAGDYMGRRASNRDITEQKRAEQERERFATQLGTAADIATQVGTITDTEELLDKVMNLLHDRFNLYHVHLYTLNPVANELVLRAGYGEPGRIMVEEGHRIPLDRQQSLVAQAARSQRPVLVNDVTQNPDFMPNPLLPDTKSEVAVPAIAGGQVLGVFDVQQDQVNYFTQGDVDVLSTLAGQLATALQTATYVEQVETRFKVSQALADAETEAQVLDVIIEQSGLYPHAGVGLYVLDQDKDGISLTAHRASSFESGVAEVEPGTRFSADEFTVLQSIGPGKSFMSPDVFNDDRADETLRAVAQQLGYTSIAIVPVAAGSDWLGAIIAVSPEAGYFDRRKLTLYQTVADQGAVALQAARLRDSLNMTQFSVDNAPESIFWIRSDASLAYASQGTVRMLGYTLEEILSMTVFEVDPVFPKEIWAEHWERIREEKEFTIESVHQTKDGKRIPVELVLTYMEYAGEEYNVTFARDITERKRAEEVIRESEERLSLLVSSVQDYAIITLDPQGHVTSWNEGAQRIKGYTEEEIVGQHFAIFYPEEDVQAGKTEMELEVATQEGHFEDEGWRLRKDGSRFWANVVITAMYDDQGNLRGFSKVTRDITERREAEEALRENEERLDLAMEAANAGVWEFWPQDDKAFFNDRWFTMLGYEPDELEQSYATWRSLLHPDDLEEAEGVILPAVAAGEGFDIEFRMVTKDGGSVWIHDIGKTVEWTKDGASRRMIGTHTDITKSKLAEQERERFTTQLRTAADLAEQVTAILDPDKFLPEVVAQLQERFGLYHVHSYLREEDWLVMRAGSGDVGQQMLEQGHAIPLDREKSIVARAARNRHLISVDDTSLEADFMVNPLLPDTRSEVAVPLVFGDRVLGVLDVQDDQPQRFTQADLSVFSTLAGQLATALQNASLFEEVQETAKRLREIDRLKSEFLANMSHELRTPLNSIIGFAEVLLMGISGELDPETQEDIQAIYDNGQHLLSLINDILDLAKIEAGRLSLHFEDVMVEPLLNEVKTANTGLLINKPIEMLIKVEDELPTVEADPVRLNQILNNLVSNAVKFTEEGSITLRAYSKDEWVYLEVEDTGIGIDDKDLEEIFEKFQQADGSFKRRAEGTGLGLAITRYLVQMHGGTIIVESELGKGSTFTVRIPIERHEVDIEEIIAADDAALLAAPQDGKALSQDGQTTIATGDNGADTSADAAETIPEDDALLLASEDGQESGSDD
jgi:PAS domain S-box-containing protein